MKVESSYVFIVTEDDLDNHAGYEMFVGKDYARWIEGRINLPIRTLDLAQIVWVPVSETTSEIVWNEVTELMLCDSSPEQARKQMSYPGEYQTGWGLDLTTDD